MVALGGGGGGESRHGFDEKFSKWVKWHKMKSKL
jgi:hypothetical protein